MAKIKDRLLLGAVTGLGGNIAKMLIIKTARKLNWAEFDGAEKAAGMLVPAYKTTQPLGRVVGIFADNVIAGILGVTTVYMLSITGKDKATTKGALAGQAMWCALYGVLTTMGATVVHPPAPKTVLTEFAGHTAFGAVAATLAAKLGDPGLFNGDIPLSAGTVKQAETYRPAFSVQSSSRNEKITH